MVRPLATSALALILGAAPVFADVTPAQVWENLRSQSAEYGYEVTGEIEDAGGTLTVTDAVFTMANDTGTQTVTVPRMTFQETGDARVRVVLDGDVAVNSRFAVPAPAEDTPEAGTDAPADPAVPETVEMTMTGTIRMPGNELVASGTPGDMLYEYSYPTLEFDLTLPTEPGQDATIPVTGSLTGLTGTQRTVASDGGTESTFDMKAAQAAVQAADADPQDGTMDFQVALTNLAGQGTVSTPGQAFDLGTQMAQALAAGLRLDTTLAFESVEGSLDFTGQDASGQDQTGASSFASGATEIGFQMSDAGMGYKIASADNRAEMTVSNLPFPISYAADRITGEMLIPVSRAEAAQPFKLAYALEGVTLADAIWNLFDPSTQLPRDPASLTIDLSGDAVVNQDLFDPAQPPMQTDANGMPAAPEPFTPETLTVNRIALDAAGAKAEITGALEFGDNPNEPVGSLNGTFDGVNGLLDKLVAMGLVPQEQIMGIRMALAMFAKPAEDNPDRLTSEIEFREGGSIFANGQQVK